ncbi:MAG: GNAT family N-acetyltransferase [Desulfobulbaceae bacterium]|jgi:ribosomal protein S18 acetylase RimI-like enzyme|nr:GNAT family N-acetyltransferase [Desulfobulbaceae bacterium]HKJ15135.1 N-acetyltransferase [Desulfobulbales bacterium]MDH3776033.1 GNAT family N-acetyltransferase [Desulfobulbaceae bacterium]MDH3782659.1 GNAT family N-acetyltransferase [Desulfobulbaceae bacterium]MDH3867273.1 GNAT family N-acetyltransferase [Desulfobulbaceae bacterium]
MKMLIRQATQEDAIFLAKNIIIAGRAHVKKGIWEVVLGGTEEECEAFLHHISVTKIPHLFHYSCYLITEIAGIGPIGGLGGYDPRVSGYHALQQAIPEVFKKLNLSKQTFKDSQERSLRILACLPKEIEGAWVIDSVAVLPEHRGKGVAEMLLNKILERGKRQGHLQAQINMYIGNEPALNLYRKFGFEIIEEKRDKYFEENIGSPGMLSLVKDL